MRLRNRRRKMRTEDLTPFIRRGIGDILLVLVILLAADVLFVMPAKSIPLY